MFICEYCGKELKSYQSLGGHKVFCKENPNIEHNLEKLNSNRQYINKHDICYCQYCGKEVGNKGCLVLHERHCENNPNKIPCLGNKGNTKGYKSWSLGKTALNNESIKRGAEKRKQAYENGTYVKASVKHTEKTKQILREKMIDYIKKNNYGKFGQHYSVKGCQYIDKLNKENNWNLQHALNGGEKQVCGYFLDGYDEKLNIAFEYDEPRHYKDILNNILSDKDIIRQNIIINELKCEFWRYNEKLDLLYKINTPVVK